MGDFHVHQVRFFNYLPQGVQCLCYNNQNKKLALSRSDGSIEILGNWYKEKVIPGDVDQSVETLAWVSDRLFSAGLSGEVIEYDLLKLEPKAKAHCNAGSIWCMVKNHSDTRLAVGTEGGCVVLFDVENGCLQYLKSFSKQEGRILCLDWHISEDVIVTGGTDNIRVWSANSGIAIERFTLKRNKESQTIVWCIKILSDMTVISGDSQGRITFWDSKFGTELQSFFSHKSDILCLAASKDERTVVCSGADPTVVHFEFVSPESGPVIKKAKGKHGAFSTDKKNKWVRSQKQNFHAHDVRAVLFADNQLVIGCADSYLTVVSLPKHFMKVSGMPHKNLVHAAKDTNVLSLQYPTYLEIWRLGHTSVKGGTDREILPLDSHPIKLVQLISKGSKPIVCSTISNNAKLVAYSTMRESRIYCLNLASDYTKTSEKPSIEHMKHFNNQLPPAHQMVFTPDCTKFILATNVGTLQILNFEHNEVTCINPAKGITDSIHLLEVSSDGRYVATGNSSREVHVFDTTSGEHVTTVPVRNYLPTAITFHPSLSVLFLVYTDMQIHEFCLTKNDFTIWSKQGRRNFHPQWLQRSSKVTNASYNPINANQLILMDEKTICVLDKTHPFPDREIRYKRFGHQGPQNELHAFHVTKKFKFIVAMNALNDGQLIIVERTPGALKNDMPPVLRTKKFGT